MSKAKQNHLANLEQAFGQVIISHREKKGLSQMDLAVSSGYSLRYIGDLERGNKSATLRTMNDIATLLEIRLSSLLIEAENILLKDKKRKTSISNNQKNSL